MSKTDSTPQPASLPQPCPREEAGAVDAWLRLTLAARFDPVLAEALPPDMLAALGQTH